MPTKYDIEQRLFTDVTFHKLVSYLTFYRGLNILAIELPRALCEDRGVLKQYLQTLIQSGCLELSDTHENPDLTCYRVTRKIKSFAAALVGAKGIRKVGDEPVIAPMQTTETRRIEERNSGNR